ncbi:ribonuclease kappa-B-like [Panulirus ornatus]|uniref:ribonuclease kappa-B-like n=1 Tax=Panulirus ornatus TaxID=150431 RepID=UPI003A866985
MLGSVHQNNPSRYHGLTHKIRENAMKLKICGPKCSLCCTIISVWGIIQLSLMALFLWLRSPAFLEDLKIDEEAHKEGLHFLAAMDDSFQESAKNCGIAAVMYAVTLVVSGWQLWVNKSTS